MKDSHRIKDHQTQPEVGCTVHSTDRDSPITHQSSYMEPSRGFSGHTAYTSCLGTRGIKCNINRQTSHTPWTRHSVPRGHFLNTSKRIFASMHLCKGSKSGIALSIPSNPASDTKPVPLNSSSPASNSNLVRPNSSIPTLSLSSPQLQPQIRALSLAA